MDSVEFLRKQSLYRPGQEGDEREWCRQMNAAADEIEKLRSALQFFVDREAPIQAKFDLHGPADIAKAMRHARSRSRAP